MAKKKAAATKAAPKDKATEAEVAPQAEAKDNGQAGSGQPGAQKNRQVVIHAQYIKDLSFENPNAVAALTSQGKQPAVEIGVQVNGDKINDNQFEVRLHLTANAKTDEHQLFLVDLTYAGIVSVTDAAPEELNPLVMIEGPRQLFPFARAIISNMTRDGGFMPLNLQPVDFVAVYRHSLQQQRQAAEAAQAETKQ